METLGQLLKREREFRGISLIKLADETRISQTILKGLEEDKIKGGPQEFYLRGFLRTYARHVGLNVEEILGRYQGQVGEQKPTGPGATLQSGRGGSPWGRSTMGRDGSIAFHSGESSHWPQILTILVAVAVVVALAALLSTR